MGSKATTVSEVVGKKDEAVYQAIEEGIQRVNMHAAARPYHIQKWAILEKDFSISGGELGKCFLDTVARAAREGGDPGRAWEMPLGSSRGSQVPDSLWVTPTFSLWEDVITQCLGLWLGRAFARGAGTHSCGPTTFNFALMKEVVSSEILTRPPG